MPVSIQTETENSQQVIDVFMDDMDRGIAEFCELYGIDDMSEAPQSKWKACMIYIHKHIFNDPLLLKSIPNINNAYDFNKVEWLYDIYLYYSSLYNKVVNMYDFSYLSGISRTYMFQLIEDSEKFRNGKNRLNHDGSYLFKKLKQDREDAMKNRMIDSKNPVAAIAIENHEENWNQPASASAAIGYKPAPRQIPADPDKPLPKPPEIPQKHTE